MEKGGTGEGGKKKIAAAWGREGYRGGAGRDQDAEEGRQGPEGPGLTAALTLGTAGRICQFRRFFLLLSSPPLL